MARFRNKTKSPLALIKPANHPDSHSVAAGDEVEVKGEITKTTDDAYIVGEGDQARAYSKALWEVVEQEQPTKTAVASKEPRTAIEQNKDGE